MNDGAVRGRPKIVEIELDSGVMVHVTPLNFGTYLVLLDVAGKKFPDPDKAQYEESIENAAVPGIKIPAEMNEEYLKAYTDVHGQRVAFILDWLTRKTIIFPEGETALRERFAEQADDLKFLKPDIDLDDWQTFIKYLLITPQEFNVLMGVLQDRFPVTEVEARDGYRLFRLQIQWAQLVRDYGRGTGGQPNRSRLERPQKQLAEIGDERSQRRGGGDSGAGVDAGTVLRDGQVGSDSAGGTLPGDIDPDGVAQQVPGTRTRGKTKA